MACRIPLQVFGERALLNNEPRAATVMVTSQTAKALALDRDAFDLLLGPLEDIIKRSQDGSKAESRLKKKDKHMSGNPNDKDCVVLCPVCMWCC